MNKFCSSKVILIIIVLFAVQLAGCGKSLRNATATTPNYKEYDGIYAPVLDSWKLDQLRNIWWSEYYLVGFDKRVAKENDVSVDWWFVRSSDLYYAYHDIDKNGVPELFISEGKNGYLMTVYAINVDDTPVPLFNSTSVERSHLYYIESTKIFDKYGSGSAFSGIHNFFKLKDNGYESEFLECLDYDYRSLEFKRILPDGTEIKISQKEYENIRESYYKGEAPWENPIELDWKMFATPPNPPESKTITVDEADIPVFTYHNPDLKKEISVIPSEFKGIGQAQLDNLRSCFTGQTAYHRSYPKAENIDPNFLINFGDRKFIFGSAQDGWSVDYYDDDNYDSTLMIYEVNTDGTVWQYLLSTNPASSIYDLRRLFHPNEWK